MPTGSSLTLTNEQTERLNQYIGSKFFNSSTNGVAKSSYWQYHSKQMVTEIDRKAGGVRISGDSGFYVPPTTSRAMNYLSMRNLARAIKQPSLVKKVIQESFQVRFGTPHLMAYAKAFDAVMGHDKISDPDLSPWRINHLRLAKNTHVFPTAASVAKHYRSWSSYPATPNIYNHYYYQNILRGFISAPELRTILEIGAGNGNFPSILYHDWLPSRLILIDLPETICLAFTFLANLFPKAKFVLPNEVELGLPETFDFALLTVEQLDVVGSDSVDLAMNCHSFQEMTHEQIVIYFHFVQRICRNQGYFFTANRVDKIPCGPDSYVCEQIEPPNRFAEYPWNTDNEVLLYEISRLLRLVQLDDVAIRLERIHKEH